MLTPPVAGFPQSQEQLRAGIGMLYQQSYKIVFERIEFAGTGSPPFPFVTDAFGPQPNRLDI